MGDEVRRSQQGNNNAYCHDSELTWFDWSLLEKHADVHRFVKLLVARRLLRDSEPELQRRSLNELLATARTAWHGVKLWQPDWSDWSHSLAFSAEIEKEKLLFHMITNAFWEALKFELPAIRDRSGSGWRRWIDTGLDSPQDIVEWQSAPSVTGDTHWAEPRSVVVLFARLDK
jgi:glycogen operon protein